MEPEEVRSLYDDACADVYDAEWHGGRWEADTRHLAEAIGRRLKPGMRWLDAGCGTGHFLSRFPAVERQGLDLSPAMLAKARASNPDVPFREADFREDIPEWHGRFDLVTSTGEPWSYVRNAAEIGTIVKHLAGWAADGGTVALLVQDITDLTGVRLPHRMPGEPGFNGELWIEAVVWSMAGPDPGTTQAGLIWPTVEHWIDLFSRHFLDVEVEHLPHDPPFLHTPRRLIVASRKRTGADTGPATVRYTGHVPPDVAAGLDGADTVSEPTPPRWREMTVGDFMDRLRPWTPRFWSAVARRVRRRLG